MTLYETSVCDCACWIIAEIHKRIVGFVNDKICIGSAEERATGYIAPADAVRSQVGHLQGGAFPAGSGMLISDQWEEPILVRRNKVLTNIKTLHCENK